MGFEHDRIFMLQVVKDGENMHVPRFPSMCLFRTEFAPNNGNPEKVLVRYALDHTFDQPENKLPKEDEVLEVPLQPDVTGLKTIEYALHTTTARGHVMPDKICKWFSDRFGYEVRLNYIGGNKREVLGNLNPNAPRAWAGDPDPKKEAAKQMSPAGGWLDGFKAGIGNIVGTVASYSGIDGYKGVEDGITYADLAAFLVANYKSHVEVARRVQTDLDVEKFRPNIVVDGDDEECAAWSEDHWGEISIGPEERGTRIAFTANCPRCASLNVDYNTGKMGEGPEGQVLKSLQSDRRVDPGFKYSPIFGRYGFLSQKNGLRPDKPITISVGDEVQITKRNDKRTHFCKFRPLPISLSTCTPKDALYLYALSQALRLYPCKEHLSNSFRQIGLI